MTQAGFAVPAAVFGPESAAGAAHALVFAPVTPRWDEGAFFTPVTQALTEAGLRVTVVDTLSAWDEGCHSMDAFVARWQALLPQYGPVDLLCGNALGGAVAQALLPHVAPATAALLVSGPARSDALLESRLTEIADLAAGGRSDYALSLLNQRVQPHGHCPVADADTPSPHDPTAGRRLAAGMRLLCGIDVTPAVRAHPGPLLQVVGSHSQLVTQRHTAAAPHHRVHVIAGAGMRPHFERTAEVSALVGAFLREKGLT
ncbi:alpha/beta hydrolase [Streptomyces sp. SID14515]|uniref:alpha/beta fold hydrolase n=1 Tax=Streptomyces sp. SID14515 TaxID=2706074 RepID=UPI0013CAEE33|nr:alpha/beta hydrolase [Streptomyces sp. SID14515]NEB36886.1 alpha/beta hydrolase [Streptomyces sp. SID14515]